MCQTKKLLQKMFHEDVVQVVRKRLELEEHLSEAQRPTALARSYYLKVLYHLVFNCFIRKRMGEIVGMVFFLMHLKKNFLVVVTFSINKG